ncbi:MAG: DUF1236 domain-containing protein [Methylobacteriaceae bacterium]|nr:DUF1236 domain-containing protein [Methylobacteriaceae bacterium]
MRRILLGGTVLGALAMPLTAHAQDPVGGAAGAVGGAAAGAATGGPVGAAVGAVTGAAVGSGLAPDDEPRFREYVVREHRPSFRYEGDLAVGTVLPPRVRYYAVPRQFGVRTYRYAIINDRPVLVEPRTRRVIEVIE